MAPRQIMNRIGNPLGADFNDADPQFGEPLWNAVVDKRMKRADDCELELTEAWLIEEKVMGLYAAVRRVNADRQIELARSIIEREEIGNAEPPVGFKSSQVDAAGA